MHYWLVGQGGYGIMLSAPLARASASLITVEIDGKSITQSNALSRYFGKTSGLYPQDVLQALYCDEVLGALEDMTHYVAQTFGLEGDALKQAREQFKQRLKYEQC